MENRELLKQLKGLKNLKPDQGWKERNREILYSQISSTVAEEEKGFSGFFVFAKRLAQTAASGWSMAVVLIVVVMGGAFSAGAARLSKPDSSLYIARIISERAQLAVTFGEEKKAQLSFRFANDHAKDITDILAKTDLSNKDNDSKAEKLTEDFKEEIEVAKNKLREIKKPVATGSEDADVFSANLGKETEGMQIAEPVSPNLEISRQLQAPAGAGKVASEEKATTTPEEIQSEANDSSDPHKILEEAEELFNVRDYTGASGKLDEAKKAVENLEKAGEVKGATESATSTEVSK